jgi:hypothetical protein
MAIGRRLDAAPRAIDARTLIGKARLVRIADEPEPVTC